MGAAGKKLLNSHPIQILFRIYEGLKLRFVVHLFFGTSSSQDTQSSTVSGSIILPHYIKERETRIENRDCAIVNFEKFATDSTGSTEEG